MNYPEWDRNAPKVPVDEDGNWLNYTGRNLHGWALVSAWYDEFEIDHMQTGRSSKIAVLRSIHTGRTYPMFIADLIKGIQTTSFRVENGVLSGTWTAVKRGTNYGIQAVL